MIEPVVVPARLADARDAAVDFAHGRADSPKDLAALRDWLFWESPDDQRHALTLVFSLSQLDLNDEALRSEHGLDAAAPISDQQRIDFARARARDFLAHADEDLMGVHAFMLQKKDGASTYACCLVETCGQAGLQPDWLGFFPSPEAFRTELAAQNYLDGDVDPDAIEGQLILKVWSR